MCIPGMFELVGDCVFMLRVTLSRILLDIRSCNFLRISFIDTRHMDNSWWRRVTNPHPAQASV